MFKPYSPEEVKARMTVLGFEYDPRWQNLPVDTPEGRKRFTALTELMADWILFWLDEDEGTRHEMLESAEEYLVG